MRVHRCQTRGVVEELMEYLGGKIRRTIEEVELSVCAEKARGNGMKGALWE